MAPKKGSRKLQAVRYYGARQDAKVSSIARRMERDYKLPTGSVALLLPSGRRARADKRIRALLTDWDWWD